MNALVAFFLGQLSLALLIFAFIKFFIFGEAPPSNGTRRRPSQPLLRASALRHKPSSLLRPAPPIAPSTILSKTFYNVSGHQPESLDWFNVLVAQTLAHLRAEALHDNAILKTATEVLNGPQKPDFLGEITVTEISLGEEFPIFSNCRIIPVDEAGVAVKSVGQGTRLLARLDVDLSDAITLGIESKLVLNYPKPLVAVLPVALAVSVVRFSGTLSISFIPAAPHSHAGVPPGTAASESGKDHISAGPGPTTLAFSFLPDYRLDLSVRSLLGSRSRLQDVPKIAQLVEARIHAWLDERCVEPRVQQIVLPGLWPRKKNTRGGDDEDINEEAIEDEEDSDGDAEREPRRTPSARVMQDITNDGGLESRMAAEGQKLLASEGRLPRESRREPADDGVRRRNPNLKKNVSTENMRIPGQFD